MTGVARNRRSSTQLNRLDRRSNGLPTSFWLRAVRKALLAYYDASRRNLPWRRTSDPYRIWIAEVMLQQTRVDTAIPYYERWLARFPDIAALAGAGEDEVLKAWEGLGYYSRARNLRLAAQWIRDRHGGRLPEDPGALRALPGIGDYTAGAIASMAFGLAEPAIDGNARRVLSRLLDDPAPHPQRLRAVAIGLLGDRPGDLNQSLMDVGALICTPRTPACDRCPLSAHCGALRAGTQHARPGRRQRPAIPVFDVAVPVVFDTHRRRLLLRRPDRGLLAGLVAFPAIVPSSTETVIAAARRAVPFPLPRRAVPLPQVEHTFTHRKERYQPFLFRTRRNGENIPADHQLEWLSVKDLERVPMGVAQREIARRAMDAASNPKAPGVR